MVYHILMYYITTFLCQMSSSSLCDNHIYNRAADRAVTAHVRHGTRTGFAKSCVTAGYQREYGCQGLKNPFLCPDGRVATGEGPLAQLGRTKFVLPHGAGFQIRLEWSIGAGTVWAVWAVWAVAHTDFWPCGPPMYLAHTEFCNLFKDWSRDCNQYSLHSVSMSVVIC